MIEDNFKNQSLTDKILELPYSGVIILFSFFGAWWASIGFLIAGDKKGAVISLVIAIVSLKLNCDWKKKYCRFY